MAAATISPEGREGLLNGAAALASLGAELIVNPEKLAKVKAEFAQSMEKLGK